MPVKSPWKLIRNLFDIYTCIYLGLHINIHVLDDASIQTYHFSGLCARKAHISCTISGVLVREFFPKRVYTGNALYPIIRPELVPVFLVSFCYHHRALCVVRCALSVARLFAWVKLLNACCRCCHCSTTVRVEIVVSLWLHSLHGLISRDFTNRIIMG